MCSKWDGFLNCISFEEDMSNAGLCYVSYINFNWYFVPCILQMWNWCIVQIHRNHKVLYAKRFYSSCFIFIGCLLCTCVSWRLALLNREKIIQTEDKGSRPSVGKHLSYWCGCEQKCRIPASSRYLPHCSDLPGRGQTCTCTMINGRNNN